jgi:hypothetical protein
VAEEGPCFSFLAMNLLSFASNKKKNKKTHKAELEGNDRGVIYGQQYFMLKLQSFQETRPTGIGVSRNQAERSWRDLWRGEGNSAFPDSPSM